MKRTGSAQWTGDLRTGKGTVSTESGALQARPYGFNTRFGDEKGTNPEELIGAAHASCFSMALSNELSKAGIANPHIETSAAVELKQVDGAFAITASRIASAPPMARSRQSRNHSSHAVMSSESCDTASSMS